MTVSCPKCGSLLDEGDAFCGDCGAPRPGGDRTTGAVEARRGPDGAEGLEGGTAAKESAGKPGIGRRLLAAVGLVAVVGLLVAWQTGFLGSWIPGRDRGPSTDASGVDTVAGDARLPSERGRVEAGDRASVDAEDALRVATTRRIEYRIPADELPAPEVEGAEDRTDAPALEGSVVFEINTEPEGARLFFDGRDLGPTPVLVETSISQVHRVRLVLAGYEEFEMDLDPQEWGIGAFGSEEVVSMTIALGPPG